MTEFKCLPLKGELYGYYKMILKEIGCINLFHHCSNFSETFTPTVGSVFDIEFTKAEEKNKDRENHGLLHQAKLDMVYDTNLISIIKLNITWNNGLHNARVFRVFIRKSSNMYH